MPAFDNVAFNRDAHRLRAWIRGQDPTIVTSEEIAERLNFAEERVGPVLGNFTTTQRAYGVRILVKAGRRQVGRRRCQLWAVNPE